MNKGLANLEKVLTEVERSRKEERVELLLKLDRVIHSSSNEELEELLNLAENLYEIKTTLSIFTNIGK